MKARVKAIIERARRNASELSPDQRQFKAKEFRYLKEFYGRRFILTYYI